MSIAVLKQKTIAKYNISGRSKNVSMGVHGPFNKGQAFASKDGGGFSLNGPLRNVGRVGKNSLFSPVRSQNLVQVTTKKGMVSVHKGWGGKGGKYQGNTPVNRKPVPGTPCCNDPRKISKPSVLNTKGMLSYKNKWKKTNTNKGNYPGQIQTIYNNWVKTGTSNSTNISKSSGQYTNTLSVNAAGCVPANMDQNAGIKTCNAPGGKLGHFIGGKYIPCTPYAKSFTNSDSSTALNNYIQSRGGLNPYGWQKSFPITPSNQGDCSGYFAKQATDPVILNGYYRNADEPRPCKKLPIFNPNYKEGCNFVMKKGCYYTIPGTPGKDGCPVPQKDKC